MHIKWIPLEHKYYKLTQMGSLNFTETGKFNEIPNLSYFNYSQAKNGGPIGKYFNLYLFSNDGKRKNCYGWIKNTI